MKSVRTSLLLSSLILLPFLHGNAQEAPSPKGNMDIEGDLVNFRTIPTKDHNYFKVTIEGLKKDMRLVLEKEVPGREEAMIIGTEKAIGSDEELPLLYCFKDRKGTKKAELYRLRGLRFDEKGSASTIVLLEKPPQEALVTMNQEGD